MFKVQVDLKTFFVYLSDRKGVYVIFVIPSLCLPIFHPCFEIRICEKYDYKHVVILTKFNERYEFKPTFQECEIQLIFKILTTDT